MRAPVYRSIDNGSTFLGLSFPVDVLIVLSVFWGSALTSTPGTTLLVTAGAYFGLRFSAVGKPPNHLQHLLLFRVRRVLHGGWFCPAARTVASHRLPWAPFAIREPARRRGSVPHE